MSDEVFLDTNILVYGFDPEAAAKQRVSKGLLDSKGWFVSWQVIQEFSSVALHRFAVPMKSNDLADYISLKLWPRCSILPSDAIFSQAIAIHARYGYRYYDCLIISSAIVGGATKLLSEDLQHGQKIGALSIINPFL